MAEDDIQARGVIISLRDFRDQIDHIMEAIAEKNSLNHAEIQDLQALLKNLKYDLTSAKKTGTVRGRKGQQNRLEKEYFAPALEKAVAHLTIVSNSHPIKSQWFSTLYNVSIDITHPLFDLENEFPDSK